MWPRWATLAMILLALFVTGARAEVIFFDDFDDGAGDVWTGWEDTSWTPREDCPGPENCWGPQLLDDDGAHAYSGATSKKHVEAQPFWYGMWHDEAGNINCRQTIIASAYVFEDVEDVCNFPYAPECDECSEYPVDPGTLPPGSPCVHYAAQSWLGLMDPTETEVILFGVHAHTAQGPEWWEQLAWYTSSDGWNLTGVARMDTKSQWRHMEIVVHPYTGQVGDVEFWLDGQKIAEGRRLPGAGLGILPTRIAIGANPAYVPEDYIANTYENFWYDDVSLRVEGSLLLGDVDQDGDVDLVDFATFQTCYTDGGGGPSAGCYDCDLDCDSRVDTEDFNTFMNEYTGPLGP